MTEKQFEAVMEQEANIRYEYFIKKVCDDEKVWILYKDSCATLIDSEGNVRFPFFPKKEFAEAFSEGTEYKVGSIELEDFMNGWLLQMKRDGIKPAIFPNGKNMTIAKIDALLKDLKKELEHY